MLNTPDRYVERLMEISTRKHQLLRDMLVLTQAQSQSITDDGVENLQKLIGEKQVKIEEINKVDEEFAVYFQRLKQQLKVKSLGDAGMSGVAGVKELQQCIQQIMDIMTGISKLEAENGERAKRLMSTFSEEIRKLNQGKKMNAAYRPGSSFIPPSYFVDKKK